MRKMALALVLLLLLPSCENHDGVTDIPEVDENMSFIGTFSPTSWTVASGDTVGLYATVVNPVNNPLAERTVLLQVMSGPGALSADSLITDSQGAVQTLLMTQEGDLGYSSVRAMSGNSYKDITVQVLDPVGPGGAGEPADVQLTSDPPSLIGNGHASSVVTATVVDGLGTPVADGTAVKFAAGESFDDLDGNGYFTEGKDTLLQDADADGEWDAIGSIDFVASTTNGTAIVTYNAPEDTGTVYVKATAGEVSEDVTIQVLPVPPELELASIILLAPSPTLQVKATGGDESTPITAYCYDAIGDPVGANWEVEFEVVSGPGGGEGLDGQGYGPMSNFTDDGGKATVSVTSGTVSGTVYIRARSGDVYSSVTEIGISAGPPVYISLGVNPGNIRAWDIEHVPAAVTALVGDLYHNPVPDGTAVYFTADEGTIVGADDSGVAFTQNGFAMATFYSGSPRVDGGVGITASTMGGNVTAEGGLITSGPPAQIYFLSHPASMVAAAGSQGDILVRVLDVNGNYVVNGSIVRFKVDYGSITPTSITQDGLYDSVAEATIYGEILTSDDSMPGPTDDGVGAVATITAGSALAYGASETANVTLTTGIARSDRSFVTIPDRIPVGTTVPLFVTVKDREGNPLGDHSLELSVTSGAIDALVVTDTLGEALVTFAAPDTAVDAMLTVRDMDPGYGGIVLFETLSVQ